MKINMNLTPDEYITLLVALRTQMNTYEKNKTDNDGYHEYWEMARRETETVLNKLYAAENPT